MLNWKCILGIYKRPVFNFIKRKTRTHKATFSNGTHAFLGDIRRNHSFKRGVQKNNKIKQKREQNAVGRKETSTSLGTSVLGVAFTYIRIKRKQEAAVKNEEDEEEEEEGVQTKA